MRPTIPAARVHALPATLADQIAAGEVVERPASVAKELVENSLDAGAARIEIEAEGGGARLLRVRDDGGGLDARDLALALERHATSKIASLDDLEAVASMGFRGEALPSIASVSRLEIVTRTGAAEHGAKLAVEGGRRGPVAPAAHPRGTTVTVRDLFYNTPARRKFLRTERTEARHVEEAVRRLALGAPGVAFRLVVDGRTAFDLPAATTAAARERRVARLCGRAFADAAMAIALDAGDLAIEGWIGAPTLHRAQADIQYFFVNGRVVREGVSRHALRQAYADLIPAQRHPAWVLSLAIDPRAVDVNVHPTKHEVRFREGRLVHDFLHRAVHDALTESGALLDAAPAPDGSAHPLAARAHAATPTGAIADSIATYATLAGEHAAGASAGSRARPAGTLLGRALAVLRGRWLIAGAPDAPILMDLPAVAAWRARERFRAESAGGAVRCRPLLVPVTLEVGDAVAECVEEAAAVAERGGLEIRRIGPSTLSLRRVPALLGEGGGSALAEVLAERLTAGAPGWNDVAALADPIADAAARAIEHGAPGNEALDVLLRELERLGLTDAEHAAASWRALEDDDLARLLGRDRR